MVVLLLVGCSEDGVVVVGWVVLVILFVLGRVVDEFLSVSVRVKASFPSSWECARGSLSCRVDRCAVVLLLRVRLVGGLQMGLDHKGDRSARAHA